jgi:hypothetical protein
MEEPLQTSELYSKHRSTSSGTHERKNDDARRRLAIAIQSMDEMRKDIRESPGLKEEREDSIEPVKLLMSSVFRRLSLKDKAFSIFPAATDHEMEAFFSCRCRLNTSGQVEAVPGPTSRIKALLLLQKVWIWCQKVWKG